MQATINTLSAGGKTDGPSVFDNVLIFVHGMSAVQQSCMQTLTETADLIGVAAAATARIKIQAAFVYAAS